MRYVFCFAGETPAIECEGYNAHQACCLVAGKPAQGSVHYPGQRGTRALVLCFPEAKVG